MGAGCLQVSRSEECGVRSRYQWHHIRPPNAKHPLQKGTTCSALPVTPQTVRDLKTNDHVTKLKTEKTSQPKRWASLQPHVPHSTYIIFCSSPLSLPARLSVMLPSHQHHIVSSQLSFAFPSLRHHDPSVPHHTHSSPLSPSAGHSSVRLHSTQRT